MTNRRPFHRAPLNFYDPVSAFTGKGRPAAAKRYNVPSLLEELGSCVYFLRTEDDLIKIGFTQNLKHRINSYKGGRSGLLFATTATFEDEQILHRRFRRHLAARREYYHPVPEIIDYINGLRAAHNIGPIPVVEASTDEPR